MFSINTIKTEIAIDYLNTLYALIIGSEVDDRKTDKKG